MGLSKVVKAGLVNRQTLGGIYSGRRVLSSSTSPGKSKNDDKAVVSQENEEPLVTLIEPSKTNIQAWMASMPWKEQTPAKEVADYEIGSFGITSHIPTEQLKRRVRISQPAKNPCKTGTDRPKHWRIELDAQEKWTNPLMGYTSGSDPFHNKGIGILKFNTSEEAVKFCKLHGFLNYFVEEKPREEDFTGKQQYAQNFLNYHVAERRSRLDKKEFSAKQFKHKSRGKSCWVNLKHTPYGEKESSVVTQTQWDNAHPNNHSAEDWRTDDLPKFQDLARRLGK